MKSNVIINTRQEGYAQRIIVLIGGYMNAQCLSEIVHYSDVDEKRTL